MKSIFRLRQKRVTSGRRKLQKDEIDRTCGLTCNGEMRNTNVDETHETNRPLRRSKCTRADNIKVGV
jgi:hypothetical protein